VLVAQKPFEIIAECMMESLPASADVVSLSERIEAERRKHPGVVRATVQTPAVFRDRGYVLETRFLVWADDGPAAQRVVEDLVAACGVACRGVHLSGRALTETDAPKPAAAGAKTSAPAPRTAARRPASQRGTRTSRTPKKAVASRRAARRRRTR
jgi:hypothetical protein